MTKMPKKKPAPAKKAIGMPEALTPDSVEMPLSNDDQTALSELTKKLREDLEEGIKNIFNIGKGLVEVKNIIGHGNFKKYVENNFNLSYRTANRFMNVAEKLGPYIDTVSKLNSKSLYLLASPSIQQESRKTVIGLIRAERNLSSPNSATPTYEYILDLLNMEKEYSEKNKPTRIPSPSARIKSVARGLDTFYNKAAKIKEYSGEISLANKEQLHHMQGKLQELETWIQELLDQQHSTNEPKSKKRNLKPKNNK